MTDWTLARIRGYYRAHAELVARQLIGRRVRGYPPSEAVLAVTSPADLLTLTEAGTGGFLITPESPGGLLDRMTVTLTTGDGADIATAATAALALADRLASYGYAAIAAVDGQGGMVLWIPTPPIEPTAARRYLATLLDDYAQLAPELTTTDPRLGGGRMLLSAAATDCAVFSWAPYSLVPGSWPGVVMPLHLDDVAAASAGMPLEIEPEDVADRLSLRGDLLPGWPQ